MSARVVPPRRLWGLTAGFVVWCSALVILYGLQGVGCAFAWSTLRVVLILVLLAHLGVLGWLWRYYRAASPDPTLDPTAAFIHTVSAWTLIAAFVATILVLGPPLLLSTCS